MPDRGLFSVSGKRVCVTGAASGIGLALIDAFLDNGAVVIGIARREIKARQSEKLISVHCDLSDENKVSQLPSLLIDRLAKIDVFVHCAWECPKESPHLLSNLKKTFTVGVASSFILYDAIARHMASSGGGSIISIGSINGQLAFPGNPAYTSCKAALHLLTKTVALDYGQYGVRANNLCPGYIHTRMTDKSYNSKVAYEERNARTMLKRWGTPLDIVGPCLFLASDASAYITGTDLYVDGGWAAKGL